MSKPSYAEVYRAFRWTEALGALGWDATSDVNLGHTIVDRHPPDRVALHWIGKAGAGARYSFGDLARLSNRFANVLRAHGISRGDRVAGYLPRIPETVIAMLGTWKAGAIWVPVFTGFSGEAIEFRVRHSGAKVLCTHWEYRARIPRAAAGRAKVVTVAASDGTGVDHDDLSFWPATNAQAEIFVPARCRREEPAVLLYTSGSTGPPKGVKIATNFLVAVYPYMRYAVDLRPDDVFWPTGDPGWGYGLVCYMGAMALGVAVISQEAQPVPEFCLSLLSARDVSNFATTPTVLRGIMALGQDAVGRSPVRVRCVNSVGEPLNAEVVHFFRRVWDVTPMDQYGASEVGLPIGNFNALDMVVKPGSMGLVVPGFEMAVVDEAGTALGPDEVGHVALRPSAEGYYSLGYWEDPERTRETYRTWITIGDLARRDADGYFWFEGRADDVIKSAGYRIGPFEIESTILRHPAVAEAAVVGKPDPLRGQIVKAYVVLRPSVVPRSGLEEEIVDLVRTELGRHLAPREVEVVDQLPKTETGKIQRFLLRTR
ncbi:MAG: AMP-binding protein [candidate division NC10 bacterium]|nr:AMP-binding protein [Candidatus Rokubacteria bacterium]MBI2560845.1 AMP-binding protein [candidate division NC10 bacterium]